MYGESELSGASVITTEGSVQGYQDLGITNFLIDPDQSIQDAVNTADDGDIINLLGKIYRENVVIESCAASTLEIRGVGAESTIVDGDIDNDGIGNGRVFRVGSDKTVTLADMTIRNGNAYNDAYQPYPFSADLSIGGGVLNESTLTVENCDIYGNIASEGGGIANWAGTSLTKNSFSSRRIETLLYFEKRDYKFDPTNYLQKRRMKSISRLRF
ncbi:MAG: hypothetical protein MUO26_08455 [Methanotrichaceae archaeon]|nr:hypothetical protein [Methanotrichaceae archaeon]